MRESISVILPAFNEGENIEAVISSILKFLPALTNQYEIIVVNDGSKDNTGAMEQLCEVDLRQQKEIWFFLLMQMGSST